MSVTPRDPLAVPSALAALPACDAAAPAFGAAMAAIGHVTRRGPWSLPAVLGVITVRVPTDLAVELVGDAITSSHEPDAAPEVGTAARGTVRITARALIGKVHVRFVRPLPHVVGFGVPDRRACGPTVRAPDARR